MLSKKRLQEDFLPLFLGLKILSDTYEDRVGHLVREGKTPEEAHELLKANPSLFPFALPPEARWESLPKDEGRIIPALKGALEGIYWTNAVRGTPLGVRGKELDFPLRVLQAEGASLEEIGRELVLLKEAVEAGEISLSSPHVSPQTARLMVRLLDPAPQDAILDPAPGDGSLLREVHRHLVEKGGARLREGQRPTLNAVAEGPFQAVFLWALLASWGYGEAVWRDVPPATFNKILSYPRGADWRELRRIWRLLSPGGTMAVLVGEETAGGDDPTGLRREMARYALGAIRLDPSLYGGDAHRVVLLLGTKENPEGAIPMADTARLRGPVSLEAVEEEILNLFRLGEPPEEFAGMAILAEFEEVREKGYSLHPGDYF